MILERLKGYVIVILEYNSAFTKVIVVFDLQGIMAAAWSADQEMFALANANGDLLVLTAHWEV